MGRSKGVCCVLCLLCFFAVPSLVLQTTGMFTPKWVSKGTGCDIGLVYSCCNGTCGNINGSHELDATASALGFHATSLAFFICAMILNVFVLCSTKCDYEFWIGVFFLAMTCAGMCNFIGIFIIWTQYVYLNYSFHLCLEACCWTFQYVVLGAPSFYFGERWYKCYKTTTFCTFCEKNGSDGNTTAVSHNINPVWTIAYSNNTTRAVPTNNNTRRAKITRVQPFVNSNSVSNEQISGGKRVLCKTHILGRSNAPSTKPFAVNIRNSVEPFTGRDDTFSTERYIVNGSDSVETHCDNGSDFVADKRYVSGRVYTSSKVQSTKNGHRSKELSACGHTVQTFRPNDGVLSVKQYVVGRRLGHGLNLY